MLIVQKILPSLMKNLSLALLFFALVFSAFAQQDVNYEEAQVPNLILPDLFVDFQGNICH